jgi:16S rRNA (uracil1498-N3)-methyltransferase
VSAPLFFVEGLEEAEVELSETDSRHALRSLRLSPGDEVSVADGRGLVARATLVGERGGRAALQVGEVSRVARATPTVSVAMAPPRGDRLSWAVQKLGELGVDEVVVMRTERSVRDVPTDRVEQIVKRLTSVAREAAMQSRRPFVMRVRAGQAFGKCIASDDGGVVLVMAQEGERGLESVRPAGPPSVRILVGPEGGWTEDELRAARQSGATLWSLGEGVLRTETAAVVGAALVLARYGRLG